MPQFDVVGVGLNATDTLMIVPHFPAYAGKVPFEEEHLSPGGQVASALVACARLGLRAKYIGAVGDDMRGQIQLESLQGTGINLDHVLVRKGCPNQIGVHHHRPVDRRADGAVAARRLPARCTPRRSPRR